MSCRIFHIYTPTLLPPIAIGVEIGFELQTDPVDFVKIHKYTFTVVSNIFRVFALLVSVSKPTAMWTNLVLHQGCLDLVH